MSDHEYLLTPYKRRWVLAYGQFINMKKRKESDVLINANEPQHSLMTIPMKKAIIILSLLFFGGVTQIIAQTLVKPDLSIYPKPEAGYKQVVIEVPHSLNDKNKKIEFRAGKWLDVDACNVHGMSGKMKENDLKGWGYRYFVFETKGDVFSTQMACHDSTKKRSFVSGQPELVNYNGKLPIVIYVPEDFEVKFRIFATDGDDYQASEIKQ